MLVMKRKWEKYRRNATSSMLHNIKNAMDCYCTLTWLSPFSSVFLLCKRKAKELLNSESISRMNPIVTSVLPLHWMVYFIFLMFSFYYCWHMNVFSPFMWLHWFHYYSYAITNILILWEKIFRPLGGDVHRLKSLLTRFRSKLLVCVIKWVRVYNG